MTVPKLLGYTPYTVISGSMEPAITTGSLVYVKETKAEDVQVADVIAYYGGRDQNVVVTHRVVENLTAESAFITKGDANAANDMTPVSYHSLLGRVEFAIPMLGYAAQLLTGREGKSVVISVIGLAVVLHLIAALINRQE